MNPTVLVLLSLCVLAVAIIYSSVGHGGASGYIAVMALFSVPAAAFKPTALVLNLLVAGVASYSFMRAGHFSWRVFWPFAVTSIPFSFIGGTISLPPRLLQPLVGVILLGSACRLLFMADHEVSEARQCPAPVALAAGSLLGLLSGLTGVGGGIFLSPFLLLLRWGQPRQVSATAAMFILVNSAAGLLGHLASLEAVPRFTPVLAAAGLTGGVVGSLLGSWRLPRSGIMRSLSLVLVIAGFKMILI